MPLLAEIMTPATALSFQHSVNGFRTENVLTKPFGVKLLAGAANKRTHT